MFSHLTGLSCDCEMQTLPLDETNPGCIARSQQILGCGQAAQSALIDAYRR